MKRNLTVLVLLVAWSLLSIPLLSAASEVGDVSDSPSRVDGVKGPDQTLDVNGAADDDSGGDPGDAGDGYGYAPPPRSMVEGELCGQGDRSAFERFLLILKSLIQLAL